MMRRKYLKENDKVFSTGCFLVLNKKGVFVFDGWEDDTYSEDGELVECDSRGYYVNVPEDYEKAVWDEFTSALRVNNVLSVKDIEKILKYINKFYQPRPIIEIMTYTNNEEE